MNKEINWFDLLSRGIQAVFALAIVCGLSYSAMQGWGGMFSPVASTIIAIALAAPFIFLTHRVVQGCRVSVVLMLVVLAFLSAEGGLTFTEGLKHAAGARFAKLEASSIAEAKEEQLSEARSVEATMNTDIDSTNQSIGSLQGQIASIAVLTPEEVTAHHEVKARMEAVIASVAKERKTGTGDNYWKTIELVTHEGKSYYKGNPDVAESELKAVYTMTAAAIESNAKQEANLIELKSKLSGLQSVLAVKEERLSEARAKTATIEERKNDNAEKAGILEEVQHTIFAKANHWAGGDEQKSLNYLFLLGFALNATVNVTAGFWLAMVTVPDERKAKMFVLTKARKPEVIIEEVAIEEPEPEEAAPDNVIQVDWVAEKAARPTKKDNIDQVVAMLEEEPELRTILIAKRMKICEATARTYKRDAEKIIKKRKKSA